MNKIVQTAIGLIFDDWWLGVGLLVSIVIGYAVIASGFDAQLAGWLLLLLCIGTLLLSLNSEYRRKHKG